MPIKVVQSGEGCSLKAREIPYGSLFRARFRGPVATFIKTDSDRFISLDYRAAANDSPFVEWTGIDPYELFTEVVFYNNSELLLKQ